MAGRGKLIPTGQIGANRACAEAKLPSHRAGGEDSRRLQRRPEHSRWPHFCSTSRWVGASLPRRARTRRRHRQSLARPCSRNFRTAYLSVEGGRGFERCAITVIVTCQLACVVPWGCHPEDGRERPGPGLLDDAVPQVRDTGRVHDADRLQVDSFDAQVVEQADTGPEEHRHDVNLDLIEEPGPQTLLGGTLAPASLTYLSPAAAFARATALSRPSVTKV